MSVEQWAGLIVSVLTIGTSFGLVVRWLVKHYFDEMKAELKPNSGSSLKDQVTRLEAQQEKLENKIDDLYDKLIAYLANPPKRNTRSTKE
jgi:chaperonin cofactor prefoldin